jgi:uncharacterized RDD family membrane protein YckC
MDRVFDAIVPRAVGAVDPDDLIERIDLDQVLARTDIDALIQRVDVDALIQRVDVDGLVQRVDVDAVVARVDIDALMSRVDVDALMARVDVDALLARVDVDALVGRIDLDATLRSVDVRALVARAGIDQAVAEAATGIATRTLDVVRRRIHALDRLVLAAVDRVLRRPRATDAVAAAPAGPLARTLGFLVDSIVVSTAFSALLLLGTLLVELFTGRTFDPAADGGPGWAAGFGLWWFTYLWASVALAGRTVGKGLLGLAVVAADGGPAGSRRAALRAVAFPFSFVLGLGFLPAVVGRRRRALHDHVAGTREVVASMPRGAQRPQTSGM